MTMMGSSVSKIIESKDKNFPVGARIVSYTGEKDNHMLCVTYTTD